MKILHFSSLVNMAEFYFGKETHAIIGCCMEVHSILGKGHSEAVYADALQYEFEIHNIPFIREKQVKIRYKNIELRHYFYCDFIAFEEIIIEIKALGQLSNNEIRQTLNYLAAAKKKVGLLVNFGEERLKHQRIVL